MRGLGMRVIVEVKKVQRVSRYGYVLDKESTCVSEEGSVGLERKQMRQVKDALEKRRGPLQIEGREKTNIHIFLFSTVTTRLQQRF